MVALILDPAHGIEVTGKRSPDGQFREWAWSRNRIKNIFHDLTNAAKGFDLHSPYLNTQEEPGLLNRVRKYNEISEAYEKTIMISLHVDAYGEGWTDPSGFTIFTSRGETDADRYATIIGLALKEQLPDERWRFDFGLSRKEIERDLDREADFTVLAGYKETKPLYAGILIENNFMSNRNDVAKLMDPGWNTSLETAYYYAIMRLMNTLGAAPEIANPTKKITI